MSTRTGDGPETSVAAVFERRLPGARAATKRAVLAQALACFSRLGIDAATIDDVRKESGQSVGTIYHHFKSKEGVVAALFFAAFDDQSEVFAERAAAARTPSELVAGLISGYLDWSTRLPPLAAYLLQAREAVARGPLAAELFARLEARYAPIDARLAQAIRDKQMLAVPESVVPALILGPSEWYCRSWLAGRSAEPPTSHAASLTAAACRALELPLPARPRRTRARPSADAR